MTDKVVVEEKARKLIEMTSGFSDKYLDEQTIMREDHFENEAKAQCALRFRKAGDLGGSYYLFAWEGKFSF